MFLLGGLTFLLTIFGSRGNYFELNDLIQRIHRESDLATVYFIGFDGEFLKDFRRAQFDIPVAIFTSVCSEYNDSFYNNTAILVVQTSSENIHYFSMLERLILQLRVRKFIIISASSFEKLQEYFYYFTEKKFTRIFGVAKSISYAYLPYADNPVQQFTKLDPLPDAMKDLNGFAFRTTLQPDIPRGFWYTDENGRRLIGGYVAQLFVSFVQKHNATFTNIALKDLDSQFMLAVFNATINNDIDISMNAYFENEELDHSYPIKMLNWVIMVPLNGYVHPNEYFLRPFTATVWICIGLTLVYIIVMDMLKDIYSNSPANLWHCFSRTILTILFMSTEKPITYAYRFHCQVLLFAFILVNLYCIHLTSFLTVYIKVKQYDTVQDLIENNVSVVIPDYEWDLADPNHFPAGFDKVVTLMDNVAYIRERNSMNTNFAYTMGIDKAEFLVGLQEIFAKPLFHIIDDSLDEYFLGFLLEKHSPFRDILNNCIIQIMESGLIEKWTRDAVLHSYKSGLVNVVFTPPDALSPLTLDHLRFAWTCLTIGLTVAMVVFMAEKYYTI